MVVVKKMPGDSDEALIRKFSRKVINEGILQEAKRREFYLKPSQAKKQKEQDERRARRLPNAA
ncbi:MAG: 30S ribosomal protein S21 [Candidatus Levybacteria bacterium]|nr:30S ribosomal protein S21 [Candidatus Levybacteria bacterium]